MRANRAVLSFDRTKSEPDRLAPATTAASPVGASGWLPPGPPPLIDLYWPGGLRATRRPMMWSQSDGEHLERYAERHCAGLLYRLPLRYTRCKPPVRCSGQYDDAAPPCHSRRLPHQTHPALCTNSLRLDPQKSLFAGWVDGDAKSQVEVSNRLRQPEAICRAASRGETVPAATSANPD